MSIQASTWVKIAFAAFLLAIAFNSDLFGTVRRGFDIRFLWAALAVQPLVLLGFIVHAMRHLTLIGTPRVPLIKAFKAMVLAQGLNLVLPARLSEIIKGTYLRDHAAVPLSIGISAVVLERTIDLIIVAGLGMIGLLLFASAVDYRMVLLFILVSALILLVAFHARTPMIGLARKIPWPRLSSFVERTYLHLHSTVRTTAFLKALIWGLVGWGISYLNIFVFMQIAASSSFTYSGTLFLLVFTTIGAAVPLLPGGIGTYEAAGVLVLRSMGYEFNEALALVISLHAAQLALPFVLAWIILLTGRLGLTALIADLRGSQRRPGD